MVYRGDGATLSLLHSVNLCIYTMCIDRVCK